MKKPKQNNADQKEDIVYQLHMFPPTPYCYNISPFAIKLESFFRINKIRYETIYTSKFSSGTGQIPYVKVNGEREICDSNVIISTIIAIANSSSSKNEDQSSGIRITDCELLTDEQRAISHSMIRMIEEHTAQIGFHYRYALHMNEFFDKLHIGSRIFDDSNSWKRWVFCRIWRKVQPSVTSKKTELRCLGRHSLEDMWQFSFDDMRALSVLLGDNRFFFGSEEPTTLDCTVFGHLTQFLDIPINFPQKKYMEDSCPNLIHFIADFKDTYWPDWEGKCERQPNVKYLKDDNQSKRKDKRIYGWLVCHATAVTIGAIFYSYVRK